MKMRIFEFLFKNPLDKLYIYAYNCVMVKINSIEFERNTQ